MIDLDRAPVITRRWWIAGHIVLWPLVRVLLRTRVRGLDNIPATGPVLIVSNHVSELDPPTIGISALPRRCHYLAKEELFRIPVLRRMIYRLGAFPVDRGGADRRAIRIAREVLARGDVLLMFPEGRRQRDGIMRPGLPGAGSLALEPGVTVVPAAIWGTQDYLGPGRVLFGPPLDLSDLADGSRSVRARAAVDRMMAGIAALVPQVGGPAQRPPGHRDV